MGFLGGSWGGFDKQLEGGREVFEAFARVLRGASGLGLSITGWPFKASEK